MNFVSNRDSRIFLNFVIVLLQILLLHLFNFILLEVCQLLKEEKCDNDGSEEAHEWNRAGDLCHERGQASHNVRREVDDCVDS